MRFRPGLICCGVVMLGWALPAMRAAQENAAAPTVGPPREVKVYETTVTVRTTVRCRRYEGKLRSCTSNPLRGVREALDPKLLLGYAGATIQGDNFDLELEESGTLKLYPRPGNRRKDYSGDQEMKLLVIYVD